jgi:hypothetical protein
MDSRVSLKYHGPAVEAGAMDVYQAAGNMIAFSEFVVAASKVAFGPGVSTKAQVSGFSRGSFVTELTFTVVGASATIMSIVSPSQLWDLLKQAISLWKHLRGFPPKKVEHHEQHVSVTNNDGQVINVNHGVINLVFSDKPSEAVGRFIREALSQEGMDGVEIAADRKTIAKVPQAERDYFVPVAPAETTADANLRMALIIEAPVFKDDNKWRFSDGQQSFHALIEDNEFLSRVNDGERFGKGDILIAEVRIQQEQRGMQLSTIRTVVRVHEHRVGPRQLSFE